MDCQQIIDGFKDLQSCTKEQATMYCAATGRWDKMQEVDVVLYKDPLRAFEMLNHDDYAIMRKYFNSRRINEAFED